MSRGVTSPGRRLGLPELLAWAVVLGGGYAAYVVGPRVLDPTDVGWLANDPAMTFVGWSFLRAEPTWNLPPTFVTRLGYPVGTSASLLDVIPAVAVPLRLASLWLPERFQYLGLVAVLHGALQMLVGMLIARRWLPEDRASVVLWGLVFVMTPVFVFRLHGHFSIAAQWLLLAAFLLYLSAERSTSRFCLWSALLVWVAGGVQPYLLAMSILVLLAALARLWLAGRVGIGSVVLSCVLGLGVALASLVFHGFFADGGSGFAAAGFRTYSFNLLGLIDPQGAGSFVLPTQSSLPGQGEGFAYLGAGVLLLAAMAVPTILVGLRRMPARAWLPLLLVCGAMAAFAASSRVTVARHVLLDVALPEWMQSAAGAFRASGRFVWPLVYLVTIACLWAYARHRRDVPRKTVLAAIVLLQAFDTSGVRAIARRILVPDDSPRLQDAVWTDLRVAHDHLVVLPAWQCGASATPLGVAGAGLFGRVAVDGGLTLNSFKAARHGARELASACTTQPRRFMAHGVEPRTVYALSDGFARSLALSGSHGWTCRRADGVVACRRGDGGYDAELRRALFPAVVEGAALPLAGMATAGWRATPAGLAIDARRAGLVARWDGAAGPLVLRLAVTRTGQPLRPVRIEAVVDGRVVTVHDLPPAAGPATVSIPLGEVASGALVGIVLRVPRHRVGGLVVHEVTLRRP